MQAFICFLHALELIQNTVGNLSGGISCLLLHGDDHTRIAIDNRIGLVRIIHHLDICHIGQSNDIHIVQAHIDQNKILKLFHIGNGISDTYQILGIPIHGITGRHIEVLCCEQALDRVLRKDLVHIGGFQCAVLCVIQRSLRILQRSGCRSQFRRASAHFNGCQGCIGIQCVQRRCQRGLSFRNLLQGTLYGRDTGIHLGQGCPHRRQSRWKIFVCRDFNAHCAKACKLLHNHCIQPLYLRLYLRQLCCLRVLLKHCHQADVRIRFHKGIESGLNLLQ